MLASADDAALATDVTFASLGVPAPIVSSLADGGITAPFPVQAATLPDALAGRDVLGRAQTGSGKTLGFSIPLVARLAGGKTNARHPRGLVLVPTRELASQVETVLRPLARAMGLRVTTVYGGVSYRPQIVALERATDILVACPGRLADLIEQGYCDLSQIEVTVVDEADQMADMGFLPIVRRLMESTPSDGQRMLFSATLDGAIDVLVRRFLTDPAQHSVDENSSPAEIEHHVITMNFKQRLEVVIALAGGQKRSLVFTRTKHGAERLARQLTEAGVPAAELHGNLRQGARARNLAAFSGGVANVMVATDIAARGIHVDGIELVIHADPPTEHKAYVHRSGRTGRGGNDGIVVTLQTSQQSREVRRLMREAGITAQQASFEADPTLVTEIAGEPAERVHLPKPVTQMVKLPSKHPAGEDGEPRSGGGRRDGRRGGRPGGDRRRRDAGPRQDNWARGSGERRSDDRRSDDRRSDDRRSERADSGDRPARREWNDRPARQDNRGYGDRPARPDRPDRPASDRPASDRGGWRGSDDRRDNRSSADRSRNDWYPSDGARRGGDSSRDGGGQGRSWGNGRSGGRPSSRPMGPGGRSGGDRRPSGSGGRAGRSGGYSGAPRTRG
jgi:superfamily II DNA/RNA helicase